MAKGKHAPAPGSVRKDKVIHPKSRKAAKIQSKEQRKNKVANAVKIGGSKLQATGDKLFWFKENVQFCIEEDVQEQTFTTAQLKTLLNAYLTRFDEEINQIKQKNSIGKKSKRHQHQSRLALVEQTMKQEQEDFRTCGLEVPDLLDQENFKKLMDWQGELRYVQNIKFTRIREKDLVGDADCQTEKAVEKEQEDEDMEIQ